MQSAAGTKISICRKGRKCTQQENWQKNLGYPQGPSVKMLLSADKDSVRLLYCFFRDSRRGIKKFF